MGLYAKAFIENNISCDCYDGNPSTPELTNNLCGVLNLSETFNLNKQYDCVISLEVGEHIPENLENVFLDNLARHCKKLLILSWGIPGQVGDGHINLRTNEYIIDSLHKKKLFYDLELSNKLKKSASLWWFHRSIMVFKV
jgi:hypothetical protein